MTLEQRIASLADTHDEDPDAAAMAIRALSDEQIPPGSLPRFTFLVNHVIGEKRGDWAEAHRLVGRVLRHGADAPAVARNAGVAALLAGSSEFGRWRDRLAMLAGAAPADADLCIRLGALSFQADAASAERSAAALVALLDQTSTEGASQLDPLMAGALNNFVSSLLELDDATIARPGIRPALRRGAERSRELWYRCGNWMNRERADYLCALTYARLGDHRNARAAAERGLAIIHDSGPEDVDRAFLLVELALAQAGLGDRQASDAARAEAESIAASWTDAGLNAWFRRQAERIPRSAV